MLRSTLQWILSSLSQWNGSSVPQAHPREAARYRYPVWGLLGQLAQRMGTAFQCEGQLILLVLSDLSIHLQLCVQKQSVETAFPSPPPKYTQ